jgi:arginyl-tRNA synthetase
MRTVRTIAGGRKDIVMNLFAEFESRIKATLIDKIIPEDKRASADLTRIVVEPPRDSAHGDLATNAAMVLSKQMGMAPRVLADQIVPYLQADADIAEVTVAGPGFINIRLSATYWRKFLGGMIRQQDGYGRSAAAARSMSNMFRPTPPGRCMSAIAAAPWSAMRSPT